MSLSDGEWPAFSLFVDQYVIEWGPYFTDEMHVAYRREHDKRQWSPAALRFSLNDLKLKRLVVHFWAKWDTHDRIMDLNLQPAIKLFHDHIAFRSLDVDDPQFQDICRNSEIVNVPSLVFFASGHCECVLVGVREPDEISSKIKTWLEEPKTR